MSKTDNLYLNSEATARLKAGIDKAAAAVGGTMGTGGSNALIQTIENPGHMATNDGATILESIRFADPIEEMGRRILLEAVSRANKASGDGSSTTTVLTAAIINEGLRQIANDPGLKPMDIKRELDQSVVLIEQGLIEMRKDIAIEDVAKVATISAEDEAIGNLIQEIYSKIGKEGIIHWDISKTTEDTYTIGKGITIEGAGYVSPYLCDLDEKTGGLLNQARWQNARILLTKQKITTAADFNDIFAKLYADGVKECVVFCSEIEASVIPDLMQTRIARGFKTMVVKMPILWRDEWYEDLAKATGATVIDAAAGLTLNKATVEHLGTVDHIIVTKEDTYIDGIRDLSEHIAALEAENTDQTKLRASRLNTHTARLYLGAHSDSALSYKRLKVEDAIAAAWQSLHGGVVPGGGVAMVKLAAKFDPTKSIGNAILHTALQAPAAQIAKNAGHEYRLDNYQQNFGLDTRSGLFVDMFEADIINPYNIELNACKNAISVAASILTTTTVITYPYEDTK